MLMTNKTGKTMDVQSLTNTMVMELDRVFRNNDIPFAHRHHEARELLLPLIASVVADNSAELAREALDKLLDRKTA